MQFLLFFEIESSYKKLKEEMKKKMVKMIWKEQKREIDKKKWNKFKKNSKKEQWISNEKKKKYCYTSVKITRHYNNIHNHAYTHTQLHIKNIVSKCQN